MVTSTKSSPSNNPTTAAARTRRLFVAYPYSFPEDDHRRPFRELGAAFGVEFQFADAKITNKHILDKITDMIVTARFSLFDVTTWNANVALELGIARGRDRDYYLLFNPEHTDTPKGETVPPTSEGWTGSNTRLLPNLRRS